MENGFVTCVNHNGCGGVFCVCFLVLVTLTTFQKKYSHLGNFAQKKLTLAPPATRRISSWRAGGEVDGDTHTEPASLKRLDLYR